MAHYARMKTVQAVPLVALSAALLLGGCGADPLFSGDPVVGPPATETGGACSKPCEHAAATPGYPTCGCGTSGVGDLIDDYEFRAKNGAKGGAAAPFETIRLGDFYDPDGKAGRKFLVILVGAIWCSACKDEAAKLPTLSAKYGPKGVTFIPNVAQNNGRGPSSDADLNLWLSAYKQDTWVARDDAFALKAFFNPNNMPLNLIIDLKTMKILVFNVSLEQITKELDARL